MSILNKHKALEMGYSSDKRKRRNQHRTAARKLLNSGGFFNGFSTRGSTFHSIAAWHLANARAI